MLQAFIYLFTHSFIHSFTFMYFEREKLSTSEGEGQRERKKENTKYSDAAADSVEPNLGLKLMNGEILT